MNSGTRYSEFRVSGEVLRVRRDWWMKLEKPGRSRLALGDFRSNGCSASPDKWRRFKLWPACHVHDFEYSEQHAEGTAAGRREADARLRRNLRKLVLLQGGSRWSAEKIAWLYWGRVRIWGADHYAWNEGAKPLSRWHRFREVWL